MPLNFSLDEIDNYNELWEEIETGPEKGRYKLNKVSEYLTYATMFVGIQKITKDNYEKFYNRLVAFEKVAGKHLMRNVGSDQVPRWIQRHIEKEEVERHIGLGTNASRMTPAKFKKSLVERLEQIGPF